jgi:transposase-like protein
MGSLSRVVAQTGQTIDFWRIEHGDAHAATRFLTMAIRRSQVTGKLTTHGREANAAAIGSDHAEHGTAITIRQANSFNPMAEQDHRCVTGVRRPILGSPRCMPQWTRAGVERLHVPWNASLEGGVE